MGYGNKFIKDLFDKAPYPFKVFITSAYGMQQRKKRFGPFFKEQIAFLDKAQYWKEAELKNYQQQKLAAFFAAIKEVPFYQQNEPYKTLLASDTIALGDFPVLAKQTVKRNSKEFYNTAGKKVYWGHTSGTTGSAMVFPLSEQAYQYEYAFREMHYRWGGASFEGKDKIAACAGHPVAIPGRTKPPFWAFDKANNHLFFSSYHMSSETLPFYIEQLEKFDPLLLHGYPSSMYLLALAYKKYGKKKLQLKAVFTASESLLDFQRQAIEESFNVKVFNWYGTSEMSANIVECECGELHLKEEHSVVEILNEDNQPCKPGETGRVVSTNFNNTAFPLIRYDVGDMVTVAVNQVAKCGRGGLLIDKVEGRIEDYVITPEGKIVGRLDHLFKDAVNVVEAQIVQPTKETIILKVVKDKNYTQKDEEQIIQEARVRLGSGMKITFEYVDRIPRTKNGKYRFILSQVQGAGINVVTV
ncbi:phenylacetate--CoA ligase family protein [Ferruginibacter sp. SUN106]|uniref:phenylacetate--CoA ligase family protein n=1 Tax=Ferruginibacter sp. SUN106 TaxID=2978348 RepID=UPI003D36D110